MPRMTPCPSCHAHVMVGDRQCPHCGASLRTTTAARASAVLMGLALAGCPAGDDTTTSGPQPEPDYGVPDTGVTETMTGTGTSTGTTDGSTTDVTMSTAGEADYGGPDTGEPEYGVPDTSGSTTDASTSAGEPDYGVPETTTTN